MSLTEVILYDTPGNFTFDAAKVEFVGALARLKDLTTPGVTFYASYTANINGNWGAGVLAGSGTGSPTISGEKLDLKGFGKFVDYDAVGNADSVQVGCVRMQFTPNYTTKPTGAWNIFFAICNAPGVLNNRIEVRHSSSAGQIQMGLTDSSGVTSTTTLSNWNPVAGVTYELEFNWDLTSGESRLFIDGVLHDSVVTTVNTRSGDSTLFRVGADYNGGRQSDGEYEDVTVFPTVQHTANYTPAAVSALAESVYATDSPSILDNSSIQMDGLDSFSAIVTEPGSDTVTFVLIVGGIDKYWDGAAWVSSSGSAQSNSAADIEANKDALDLTLGAIVAVKAYLNSDDGTSRPDITSVTVLYNFFIVLVAPPKTIVYGWTCDPEATPLELLITVQPIDDFEVNNKLVLKKTTVSTVPDANGYWEIALIAAGDYKFTMDNITGFEGRARFSRTVPVIDAIAFEDLVAVV